MNDKDIKDTPEEMEEVISVPEDEQSEDQNEEETKKSGIWGKSSKKSKWEKKYIELTEEYSELKDKQLRLHAEFDNFRKRSLREKLDYMKTASQETMRAILPLLDDFDRAKEISDSEESEEKMTEGMELLYNKMHHVLAGMGLKKMESDEVVFDSELHEAITKAPAPSEDMKGKVLYTIEKGYLLNDKIIRHAKVVVAS